MPTNATAPAAGPDAPPSVADHELLRRVGVGAYGEVWLARSVTGILRAVKIVWRKSFDHERSYEREFAGLKKFEPLSRQHHGLVDVLHVGRNDELGYFFYVMELADDAGGPAATAGEYVPLTLAELLGQRGRLPVTECARIGAGVAEALAFLHGEGLVHRDIKPSNLVFVGGRPKLADVGLVAGLADARSFVGTEGYIPPEGPGSTQADLFSLGRVLYEMATGKSRHEFPDLPGDFRDSPEAEAFSELNEIILRACAPEAGHRHATALELRSELLLIDAGRSVRRLRLNERRVAVWRRFGLAAVAVAFLGLAITGWQRQQTRRAQRQAATESRQRQVVEEKELAARENLYSADMNLAQQAIDAGNFGRAEELLKSYEPRSGERDLRGFEWFHFSDRLKGDSLGVIRGHADVVSDLALSGDGRRLYSASFDSTVREWSLPDLRQLRRWELPGVLFATFALSADERFMALEGGNRPASALLDLTTGTWTTNRSSASSSVALLQDGRVLRGARSLLFDTNGVIELTDRTFRVERVLEAAGGRLALSPDGRLLATGPWGDSIRLWNWPDLTPVASLGGAGTVLGLTFSTDSRRLASISREGELVLWDAVGHGELKRVSSHGGAAIWCVAFSPDGRHVATGGNDQAVRVRSAATLAEERVFRGHGSEVWSVVWAQDGERLYSSGKDRTIRVWDAAQSHALPTFSGLNKTPQFSPDERWIALQLRDETVRVVEATTGRERFRLSDILELGGFSADGQVLNVIGAGPVYHRRAADTGVVLDSLPLKVAPGNLTKRLLTTDGHWLISGFISGQVVVQDLQRGGEPFTLTGHQEMIVALGVANDGRQLLTGCIDRTANLWDLETRQRLHTFAGHRMAVGSVAFSSDDGLIATGGWDDTVLVWNAHTRERIHSFGGETEGVQSLVFAPAGRTLATLSGAGRVTFWSLAAGREAGAERLPRGVGGGWLQFSPQGRWLGAVAPGREMRLLRGPGGADENLR